MKSGPDLSTPPPTAPLSLSFPRLAFVQLKCCTRNCRNDQAKKRTRTKKMKESTATSKQTNSATNSNRNAIPETRSTWISPNCARHTNCCFAPSAAAATCCRQLLLLFLQLQHMLHTCRRRDNDMDGAWNDDCVNTIDWTIDKFIYNLNYVLLNKLLNSDFKLY